MVSLICRTLTAGQATTQLGYTIKNHKDQGSIVPRSLHLARNPMLHGLSAWITWKMDPELKGLSHIMKDSFAFRRSVHNLAVPLGAKMVAIDLKDFFLSGSPSELARDSTSGSDDPLLREAALIVLEHQYVQSATGDYLHQCVGGSGMGLGHSAHIANLAFYHAVEVPFFAALPSDNGILSYTRYHDDILVILADREKALAFYEQFRSRSAYFRMLVRDISMSTIKHLDLTLSISGGRVRVEPSLDKIPIPLSPTSAHPPSIHAAWPASVCNRIAGLSSQPEKSICKLQYNYRVAGADPSIMHRLQLRKFPSKSIQRLSGDLSPMVLRYHPLFRAAVSRAIMAVPPPSALRLQILTSWTNALPSTASFISKHNRRVHSDHRVGQLSFVREG